MGGILGWLGNLLGLNQGDPNIDAGNQNKDVAAQYGTTANDLIDTGSQAAGGYLGQVSDQYQPLATDAVNKGQLYSDALGVNGPTGNATATSAFQTSPGYQFSLDQGEQALDRSAAAHGTLQSGQSGIDTIDYGTNAANQEYSNWLSNLGSSNDILGTGLSGESTSLGNLATLATNTAGAKTNVAGQVASGTMSGNNQIAAGQTTNDQGIANLGSSLGKIAGNFLGYGGF